MPVRSLSGKRYMMTIWDEATSFLWSYPIERKSDAYEVYARWQARVERETGKRVRTLRTDNGGEYTSNTFKTYLNNRLPTSTNDGKTPYEAYHGSKPPLHHLRTFGSKAYVYDRTHNKHQSKTIDCVLLGYGDDQYGKKAYRLKAKSDGRIVFSRDVKFDETPANRPRQVTIEVPPRPTETDTASGGERERRDADERSRSPEGEQPRSRSASEERHIAAQRQDDPLDRFDSLPRAQPTPAAAPAAPTGPTRPRRETKRPGEFWKLDDKKGPDEPKKKPWVHSVEYANFVALAPPNKPSVDAFENGKKIPIPKTFHEAITSEHAVYWKSAMDEEMSSFEANGVFELTELPESRKPVGGRWVYSIKRNEQGAVSKFKARWVAKGYSQREGIDFTETYVRPGIQDGHAPNAPHDRRRRGPRVPADRLQDRLPCCD
jgi:hypothetical protein